MGEDRVTVPQRTRRRPRLSRGRVLVRVEWGGLDGRSGAARARRQVAIQLREQLGGEPTFTQRVLISSASKWAVIERLLEGRVLVQLAQGGEVEERLFQQHRDASDRVRRLCLDLGLGNRPLEVPRTLEDWLAASQPAQDASEEAEPTAESTAQEIAAPEGTEEAEG